MVRLRGTGNRHTFPMRGEKSQGHGLYVFPWNLVQGLDSMGRLRAGPGPPDASTYLRCHKVGRVARCHKEPILSPQLLGKAKVTDAQALGVPRLIHIQDVTGFEVPVDDLEAEGWGWYMVQE